MSDNRSPAEKYPHYYKDVTHLSAVDVYLMLHLFPLNDDSTCLGHAVKKIMVPGGRGAKGRQQDIEEAIDSLKRFLEINYGADSLAHHQKESTEDKGDCEASAQNLSPISETPSRLRLPADVEARMAVERKELDDKPCVSYSKPPGRIAKWWEKRRVRKAFEAAAKMPPADPQSFYTHTPIEDNYYHERTRIHAEVMAAERARLLARKINKGSE